MVKSGLGDLVPDIPRIIHIAKEKVTFLDIASFRISSFVFDASRHAESKARMILMFLGTQNFFQLHLTAEISPPEEVKHI